MMYLETPPRLIETKSSRRCPMRFGARACVPIGPTPIGRASRPTVSSKARHSTRKAISISSTFPFGRIFRIAPDGEWSLVVEYDGWPNGLKISPDGRILVADYRHGIMELDARGGRMQPVLTARNSESFRGCNDLHIASNGDIYFTDQGQTGLHDPTGRVYRLSPDGRLDCLIDTGISPNGLVLDPTETVLFVAMTRDNAVWRMPLMKDGSVVEGRPLLFDLRRQRSRRPDHGQSGPAVRGARIARTCLRVRAQWRIDRAHQILRRAELHQCRDRRRQPRPLYITESATGTVLVADIGILIVMQERKRRSDQSVGTGCCERIACDHC